MLECRGYAAQSAKEALKPFSFKRRDVGPKDVRIAISYCGVCHSDIHMARNEWRSTIYPCVPGHEIVGEVVEVGSAVTRFKKGDLAGVGCLVDSCGHCQSCQEGLEQYCETGSTMTYGSDDPDMGTPTFGGYSDAIVVTEKFALNIPKNLDLAAVAPLLCAGITTWSPLRHWKAGPGTRVGVIGLGGLGHMALKLGRALGAEMTLFTTSQGKVEDAKRLGAHHVVMSKDKEEMAQCAGKLDLIIDTVAVKHPVEPYLATLKREGVFVFVGLPEDPLGFMPMDLASKRRSMSGSFIGGIPETQEMLDFCGKHNITSDIEMIAIKDIEAAYDRMQKSDVKYRFVIDLKTLEKAA